MCHVCVVTYIHHDSMVKAGGTTKTVSKETKDGRGNATDLRTHD